MGRIGSAVAAGARNFGLTIQYCSRNRRPPALEERLEATFHETVDDLIAAADIVSLHTPLTRDTQGILSRARIRRMRPEAFVVNVSRPELIDEEALIEALEANRIAGAALDVFAGEGSIDPRLRRLAQANRVIVTPHMASATLEARLEMGDAVIVNIRAFVDGHQPPHRVLPETRARA
jgi:glyoxylate reductase